MFIAKPAEQRKEFRQGNVDSAADLDGFDQDGADFLAAEKAADLGFGFRQPNPGLSRAGNCPAGAAWPVSPPRRGQGWLRPGVPVIRGKRNEMPEPAKLRAKMGTEMRPMRRVQRAVAESTRQVVIFISVGIPDLRAARTFPHGRPGTIRFDERHVARFKALEYFEDLTGVHQKFNRACTPCGTAATE